MTQNYLNAKNADTYTPALRILSCDTPTQLLALKRYVNRQKSSALTHYPSDYHMFLSKAPDTCANILFAQEKKTINSQDTFSPD